jgi:hypothetical protein
VSIVIIIMFLFYFILYILAFRLNIRKIPNYFCSIAEK